MTRLSVIVAICAALWAAAPAYAAAGSAPAPLSSSSAASYADSVRAVASELQAAAQAHSPHVPSVHVPPAPLPGSARSSPSLDGWLQPVLASARTARPKARAKILTEAAATLRYAAATAESNELAAPARPIQPTLAAILANPAYHERESSEQAKPQKTWWDRFIEWLANLFEKLLEALSSAAAGVPWIGQIVAAIIIIIIAWLLLFVGYRLARYIMSLRRSAADRDAGETIEVMDRPEELYERARAAAAQGHYAAAIALVFRAALLQLDAGGVVPYDAARTAGEYRRVVRRRRVQAALPFDEMARSFTLVAYAETPVGERDWRGADGAYRSLMPLVAASGTEAAER